LDDRKEVARRVAVICESEKVDEHLSSQLQRYITDGHVPINTFLKLMLQHKVYEALLICTKDEAAVAHRLALIMYWELPPAAHGDRERVIQWCNSVLDSGIANCL